MRRCDLLIMLVILVCISRATYLILALIQIHFPLQEQINFPLLWKMIFGALQIELFRFKIHSLGSKILKFLEFNLSIAHW